MRQIHVHVHGSAASVRVTRGTTGDAKPKTYAQLLDDLANRMAAALEELMGWATKTHDEFREADHPRASDGRFGTKAGEHGHADTGPKPTSSQAKGAFNQVRDLLGSGHSFTREELMAATGLTPKKLGDYLAMLKNPKYAGPAGALNIVKNPDGTFAVAKTGAGTPPAAPPVAPRPPVAPPPPPPPPAPPAPAPVPAPAPAPVAPPAAPVKAPGSYEEALSQYEALRTRAYKLGHKTKATEQAHRAAADAYEKAAYAAYAADKLKPGGSQPGSILARMGESHTKSVSYHLGKVRELQEIAKRLPADNAERVKKIEARFLNYTPANISTTMQEKFGLHVSDGATYYMVRGAKPIDINKKSAGATGQRKMLGHVYSALEDLDARGFDVKAAIARGKPVEYAPASLSRCNGLAWQGPLSGKARFTVSGSKRLNDNADQYANNQARLMKGQHRWSISAEALGPEAARATIVHELAHAVGMRPGVDSAARLSALLTEHMKTEPPDPLDMFEHGRAHRQRTAWIKKNISEYAAANIHETDAELAAMVTAPSYVRGTLPKAFEDHVDWLFAKRSTA